MEEWLGAALEAMEVARGQEFKDRVEELSSAGHRAEGEWVAVPGNARKE